MEAEDAQYVLMIKAIRAPSDAMARKAGYKIRNTGKGWMVNVPAKHSPTGSRQRRYFETKGEAEGFVQKLGVEIDNFGLSVHVLKPTEVEQTLAAMRLLKDAGSPLGILEAVRLYLKHEETRKQSRPVLELIDAFLASKRRSAKYSESLQRTKTRLMPLHKTQASDVSPELIEELVSNTADTYRNALLREIRAIFGYALKRGWCQSNPVARVDFARVRVGEREIYSVEEAASLLGVAQEHHPQLLPFCAIGLFAGVRVFELLRLDWRNVDLGESSIDLPANITKRERRRSIPVEAVLLEWLKQDKASGNSQYGFVVPYRTYNTLRKHLRDLFKRAKVQWRQNAARHSYASYWLAEHNDLTRLALHMGHVGGLEVLHTHYHRAVRKAEAAKYWALKPGSTVSTLTQEN